MAGKLPKTSHTFARHVAPFAPLALALLMNGTPASPGGGALETETPNEATAVKCDEVTDFQDCHTRFPTGCSAAAGYDAYLNLLKNQSIAPPPSSTPVKFLGQQDFHDLESSTPTGLSGRNHSDFKDELTKMGEGQLHGMVGFLYYFQPTGAESSNCQLTGPADDVEKSNVDYHIGIGFDPTVAKQVRANPKPKGDGKKKLEQSSVIVEMTPFPRFLFENGIWTVENLQKAVGRQVKVVGQLMVDSEHNIPTQNCARAKTADDHDKCWRASVWELHPVVRFQVCTTDSCSADSTDWVELDQL